MTSYLIQKPLKDVLRARKLILNFTPTNYGVVTHILKLPHIMKLYCILTLASAVTFNKRRGNDGSEARHSLCSIHR